MPILGSFGAGSAKGFGFSGGAGLVEDVDFLIVAGGGGGRNQAGSGGGAGGYVATTPEGTGGGNAAASKLNFVIGEAYTITIGAGGAGRTGDETTPSVQGSNNVLVHADGTQTVYGGGADGYAPDSATIGSGQGIGPGNTSINPTGQGTTSGQGYPGGGAGACGLVGAQCNSGGGGGAGAAGEAGTNGNAGAGGAGLTSPLDSTGRAGGGGGSGRSPQGISAGPASDGGGAGTMSGVGTAGTTNTGGGGGGSSNVPNAGGAGGSGIIILKYPDTNSITFSSGVTSSTSSGGGYKTTTVTATSSGSETLTFS